MAFVTDVLWRSPLGLRINAQTTADVLMTEDWVKLRGDQLQPRDGFYDLRITAELWETHFFDLASLLIIDHPRDTEVFVDERFAVPPPKTAVTVTGPVQTLAAAHDDTGRDVGAVVSARDDRYLDFAGRGAYQGVTRDHFVEIEIPDAAPRTGPLWLIAQGWIHPSDSSINVALGQGGTRDRRAALSYKSRMPPAVSAPRGRTSGFPAGKNKTVLIDLGGLFGQAGRRRAAVVDEHGNFLGSARVGAGSPRRQGRAAAACSRVCGAALSWILTRPSSATRARRNGRATRSRARRRAGATWRATTRGSATSGNCCSAWTIAT